MTPAERVEIEKKIVWLNAKLSDEHYKNTELELIDLINASKNSNSNGVIITNLTEKLTQLYSEIAELEKRVDRLHIALEMDDENDETIDDISKYSL